MNQRRILLRQKLDHKNDLVQKIITMEAIGAPITEADRAAIPANINASPNWFIRKLFPIYVSMPPMAAPKTNAGEKTPPKKPILKQITVTKSININIIVIKPSVKFLSSKPTIVSPPRPKTSGTNPPAIPTKIVAQNILKSSEGSNFAENFCKNRSDLIKMTATIAQMGPSTNDKETDGSTEISELVFCNKIPVGKK